MKKILLLILFAVSLYSCGNNEAINPPLTMKKNVYQIIMIDGCEYIFGCDNYPYNGGYFLTHKGNCKNSIHYQNIPTNMVSPIVEIQADYKNIPSYCKPQNYSIVKVGDKYYVRLPHGSIDENYDTPQEAQKSINERANRSMNAWLESGGLKF